MHVCFVTGTRADYGLLQPVIEATHRDPFFRTSIVASCMHLSPEFGMTVQEIEADGYTVDARVDMLLSGDSRIAVAKSMGIGVLGFADAFDRLKPDLIVLLGDRFEALAAAETALICGIPVAHVSGGDVTYGAFDDSIRHAITKMAHLHFVASEDAAARVRQLGEADDSVFAYGDPGLDRMMTMQRMGRDELAENLGIVFRKHMLLFTFHPVTVDAMPSRDQLDVVLGALDDLGDDYGIVITMPNADPEGRELANRLRDYTSSRENVACFASLGSKRYISLMAESDAVVGNSSSGLLEAPSFGKPTVNIGERQAGRLRAASVIDCPVDRTAIATAIRGAVGRDFKGVDNPYGDGHTAEKIIAELKRIDDPRRLLKKIFVDRGR
ncbi:UDP-N-acetylglucosamine 2-epimerase [Pacificispira spongiicola]|nr:UDP-N-acetylglucosamine 2-epimerase [Pacificispira spongiicola]